MLLLILGFISVANDSASVFAFFRGFCFLPWNSVLFRGNAYAWFSVFSSFRGKCL